MTRVRNVCRVGLAASIAILASGYALGPGADSRAG